MPAHTYNWVWIVIKGRREVFYFFFYVAYYCYNYFFCMVIFCIIINTDAFYEWFFCYSLVFLIFFVCFFCFFYLYFFLKKIFPLVDSGHYFSWKRLIIVFWNYFFMIILYEYRISVYRQFSNYRQISRCDLRLQKYS